MLIAAFPLRAIDFGKLDFISQPATAGLQGQWVIVYFLSSDVLTVCVCALLMSALRYLSALL